MGYDYHQILQDEGFQKGDIIYSIDGEEMTDIVKTQHKLLLDRPSVVTVMRPAHISDTVFYGTTAIGEPVNMEIAERDTMLLVDLPISCDLLTKLNPRDTNLLFTVRAPFVVKDFGPGSRAKRGGMHIGDSVVSINGEPMNCYTEISSRLKELSGQTITIGVWRDGGLDSVNVEVDGKGKIGVYLTDYKDVYECVHTDYTFFEAFPVGISYGWNQMTTYIRSLRVLFTPDGFKGLGGFGTLGGLFPDKWNWYSFWTITALLALILAFMNVIPIPGLDGGHILFTLWEIVTRRKPSEKFLDVAQTIGMALLLLLLVVANGNDILRWLGF